MRAVPTSVTHSALQCIALQASAMDTLIGKEGFVMYNIAHTVAVCYCAIAMPLATCCNSRCLPLPRFTRRGMWTTRPSLCSLRTKQPSPSGSTLAQQTPLALGLFQRSSSSNGRSTGAATGPTLATMEVWQLKALPSTL